FTACGQLAVGGNRTLLLWCHGQLHAVRRSRLLRHGPGRCFFQAYGRSSSQMANAGLQPDWTGYMGLLAHREWALRSALHLRDLWNGPVVHADRDWLVRPAMEAPRRSSSLPLHWLPLAAGLLHLAGRVVDHKYDGGAP